MDGFRGGRVGNGTPNTAEQKPCQCEWWRARLILDAVFCSRKCIVKYSPQWNFIRARTRTQWPRCLDALRLWFSGQTDSVQDYHLSRMCVTPKRAIPIRNGLKIKHGSGRIRDVCAIKWTDVKSLYRKSYYPLMNGTRTTQSKSERERERSKTNQSISFRATFNYSALAYFLRAINREYPEQRGTRARSCGTHTQCSFWYGL